VVGEGATYRLIGDLAPTRITRPALRAAQRLDLRRGAPSTAVAATPAAPLALRIDTGFTQGAAEMASATRQ
jgi:hypothetical protein